MTDIVVRLRVMARLTGRDDDADTAAEAAREIERLSLTNKERKALAFAAEHFGSFKSQAATLRSLLERLK